MRVLVIALLSFGLSLSAMADSQEKWQVELDQYQATLPERSNISLVLGLSRHATVASVSCGASLAVATASFVSDTLPLSNVISETIANMADKNYQTQDFDSILSLEALPELGRGATGGAVIGAAEMVEFLVLILTGEEKDRGFEALKKLYASSFATLDALFAEKGKCMMSVSKTVMLVGELKNRMSMGQSFVDTNPDML